MAALRHPNVVAFMGFCAAPPAIVTELCARGSLTDVLKAAGRDPASLPWPQRLTMAIDAATGMRHLHSQAPPIVHRGLKSPNLLVDKDWNVKVFGFQLTGGKLKRTRLILTTPPPPPRSIARSRTSTSPR
jgi:serine/threonine protein kinase